MPINKERWKSGFTKVAKQKGHSPSGTTSKQCRCGQKISANKDICRKCLLEDTNKP